MAGELATGLLSVQQEELSCSRGLLCSDHEGRVMAGEALVEPFCIAHLDRGYSPGCPHALVQSDAGHRTVEEAATGLR